LDSLENIYINASRKLEFITTLEGAAAKNGVEQKLNLDLKFNSDGTIKKVPIIIEISGSFASVMNYLIALETFSYYININSFDLSFSAPAKEEAGSGRYNLRLTANTYWK
jgi:Tfp pilus assembly protein PilO